MKPVTVDVCHGLHVAVRRVDYRELPLPLDRHGSLVNRRTGIVIEHDEVVGVLCFLLTFAVLDHCALQDRLAILLADLEFRQQVKYVGDGAWTILSELCLAIGADRYHYGALQEVEIKNIVHFGVVEAIASRLRSAPLPPAVRPC